MKTASQYIRQPTDDQYGAWAVWTPAKGEFILCGRPKEIQRRGITVLCTCRQRLEQIGSLATKERQIAAALANAEWSDAQ